MNKISSYSKYQKDIIKRIAKELGTSIAFSYGKCSNNHLKVYVDGLDKPFYTSSTPSDRKAGDNFMGDLRCALKAAHLKRQSVTVVTKHINNVQLKTQYIENLKGACIKTVRTNIDQYTEKEELMVIKENRINSLKPQRKKLASKIFEHTKKTNKNMQYITGKDIQSIKDEIIKHLNYMLPNTADYVHRLKPVDTENKLSKAVNVASGNTPILSVEAANEGIAQLTNKTKMITDVVMNDPNSEVIKKSKKTIAVEAPSYILDRTNKNPAEVLAAMSKEYAVQNLRRLSRNEGEAMLANIALAMDLNHQQDLNEVSELMEAKGIDLGMMAEFLNGSIKMAS
jgi:predicted metallo-beta-lactamase superfamily hydrolase